MKKFNLFFTFALAFIFLQSATAQITVSMSGGTIGTSASSWFVGDPCGPDGGYGAGISSRTNGTPITLTFNSPVTSVNIPIGAWGDESHVFDVLGQSNEVLTSECDRLTFSGNVASYSSGTSDISQNPEGIINVSSNVPFTQITISKNPPTLGNFGIPRAAFLNAMTDFAVAAPADADGDGIADTDDTCPNTPAGTTVTTTGCPDADGDGIADTDDTCSNTPAGTVTDAQGCPDTDGDSVTGAADPDGSDACNPSTADAACITTCNAGNTAPVLIKN